MKEVIVKVYEFKELSDTAKQKLTQSCIEQIVDEHFEAFAEYLPEYMKETYGVADAQFGYSLSYQQGDGLHFNTEQFLTEQVAKKIEEGLTTREQYIFTKARENGMKIRCKSSVHHYEYANINDVEVLDTADDADYLAEENADISLREATLLFNKVEKLARNLYMDICKELEKSGYSQYNVSEEEVNERLDEVLYFEDGRIYGEKE